MKTVLIILICIILQSCGAGIHTETYTAIITAKTFTTTTVRNIKTNESFTYPDVFPEAIEDTVYMQDWRFE